MFDVSEVLLQNAFRTSPFTDACETFHQALLHAQRVTSAASRCITVSSAVPPVISAHSQLITL